MSGSRGRDNRGPVAGAGVLDFIEFPDEPQASGDASASGSDIRTPQRSARDGGGRSRLRRQQSGSGSFGGGSSRRGQPSPSAEEDNLNYFEFWDQAGDEAGGSSSTRPQAKSSPKREARSQPATSPADNESPRPSSPVVAESPGAPSAVAPEEAHENEEAQGSEANNEDDGSSQEGSQDATELHQPWSSSMRIGGCACCVAASGGCLFAFVKAGHAEHGKRRHSAGSADGSDSGDGSPAAAPANGGIRSRPLRGRILTLQLQPPYPTGTGFQAFLQELFERLEERGLPSSSISELRDSVHEGTNVVKVRGAPEVIRHLEASLLHTPLVIMGVPVRTGYVLMSPTSKPRCGALLVPHDDGLNLRCSGTPQLAWCRIRCPDGYDPSWPLVTCDEGGTQWREQSECVPRICGSVPRIYRAIPSVYERCANLEHGATCKFECEVGYEASGDLICHLGQVNFPRCLPGRCSSSPELSDGMLGIEAITDTQWSERGEIPWCRSGQASEEACRLPCADGLQPPTIPKFMRIRENTRRRAASLFCFAGHWRVLRSCGQAQHCLSASELEINIPKTCAPSSSGALCLATLPCPNGQEFDIGVPQALLCRGGLWLRPPCVEAACTEPPIVAHSDIAALRLCSGAPARSSCRVRCKNGYELPGHAPSWLVCRSGVWRWPRTVSAATADAEGGNSPVLECVTAV
eukprot:TRINITY_DN55088_c0_g1_i1.p1 TRINITY_DN55088_c0_g1~~TRINITY_DN55088_c0_g1_i1.p1  ORF type:complete len:708 (+),score=98.82 TRINITY_DN55088_c0_g1_i1:50-2125(+)